MSDLVDAHIAPKEEVSATDAAILDAKTSSPLLAEPTAVLLDEPTPSPASPSAPVPRDIDRFNVELPSGVDPSAVAVHSVEVLRAVLTESEGRAARALAERARMAAAVERAEQKISEMTAQLIEVAREREVATLSAEAAVAELREAEELSAERFAIIEDQAVTIAALNARVAALEIEAADGQRAAEELTVVSERARDLEEALASQDSEHQETLHDLVESFEATMESYSSFAAKVTERVPASLVRPDSPLRRTARVLSDAPVSRAAFQGLEPPATPTFGAPAELSATAPLVEPAVEPVPLPSPQRQPRIMPHRPGTPARVVKTMEVGASVETVLEEARRMAEETSFEA
eukprot:gnl/Ergobibamus_cyprinoides/2049.p1 GENE.gnl/Ergobibamus_cyprinoides/2049~~gnl/Ergobibamus_cyprinoides/2049.p1  ORF type:complete len:359 (+),score=144.66 gnl/Ergobibamus_cyprinoides/2049:39-1079(+)